MGVISRLIKTKVVFIVHNVEPHEKFPFWRQLTKYALRSADYLLTLSRHTYHQVCNFEELDFISKKSISYPQSNHVKPIETNEARSQLGGFSKTKRVILFFGLVRKYKGLDILLEAMPEIIRSVGTGRRFHVQSYHIIGAAEGAQTVIVNALTLAGSAPNITVDAPITISVNALTLAGSAPNITVIIGVTVSLPPRLRPLRMFRIKG